MIRRPLSLSATAVLLFGTLVATSPATATTGVPEGSITEQARTAASYLGTTPQQAEEFFKRQNADLDALDRLNRLTAETDGAFFKNGEATVNVTSARAAGLARQLGLTPRFAVRGKRALEALGARASRLAEGSASAPDLARQQVVVYLELASATKQLRGRLATVPGVRVELTRQRADTPVADGLHYAGRSMRMYYASNGQFAWPCTQGFGGTIEGKRVMMTVGHCVEDINTVRNSDLGQAFLGWRIAGAYFTGYRSSDVGLIQISALADSYTNIDTHLGTKVVQGRGSPVPGMTICKSGATTGWTCGDVIQHFPPYARTYPGNTPIKDLWSMTACVRPGDSGGPIMSGDYAIGLTSGAGPLHGVTACPGNSGRSSETGSDVDHTARFVSIDHLRASYPGLELRHS